MAEVFDIIDFPLKIKNPSKLTYTKVKSKYEFRILECFSSKKIYASKTKSSDLFLLISVENNLCVIIGHTKSTYTFTSPLDFYVDMTESQRTYNTLADSVLNKSVSEMLSEGRLCQQYLPDYVPPILYYSERTGKIGTMGKEINIRRIESKTIKVYYTDPIPTNEQNCKIQQNSQLLQVEDFIRALPHPILKINHIYALFKLYKKNHNLTIKNEVLKKILPFYRYFMMDGPFRKSWIPYDYDPKQDWNNYKYQIIDFRHESVFVHLFEQDTVVQEVEKNREWYCKNDCDIKDGFFKKTLWQLILYRNYIDMHEDDTEGCFELLE